jgi:hypothetical protein
MPSKPDLDALRAEILDLHRAEIQAHWDKDVDFFVRDISDDYVAVAAGEISPRSVEQIRAQFSSYLNNTTFSEYRDLAEPRVGISKDGSLAWAILQVRVVGQRRMEDGSERELDFICAWMTLYEREGERWMRLADASTFKGPD